MHGTIIATAISLIICLIIINDRNVQWPTWAAGFIMAVMVMQALTIIAGLILLFLKN